MSQHTLFEQTPIKKDVEQLMFILDRIERNPEASGVDKAMIGRMRANARMIGKNNILPNNRNKPRTMVQFQRTLPPHHLGRGCPED